MNRTLDLERPSKHRRRSRCGRLDRLALACAGRPYRNAAGELWLIRSALPPCPLFDVLRKVSHDRSLLALPTPTELGFETSQGTWVAEETLALWRRKLARLRALFGRGTSRLHRPWYVRQAQSLDALDARLTWLSGQLGRRGEPGYLLETAQEAVVSSALAAGSFGVRGFEVLSGTEIGASDGAALGTVWRCATGPNGMVAVASDAGTAVYEPVAGHMTLAEVAPDSLGGTDLLGVAAGAAALADVIAARTTSPPLSIGLFADWGSGKSFLIKLIQERVRILSRRASGNPDAAAHCGTVSRSGDT